MIAIIPSLRAFARLLAGRQADLADDLAQEALAKAWAARDSFTPGTNFKAWIFRILRNHFYTTARVGKRFVVMDPMPVSELLVQQPTQEWTHNLQDVERGLKTLPPRQQEVLMLLAAGMQWRDIAKVVNCPIGTVKSRITRGRLALKAYLEGVTQDAVPDTRAGKLGSAGEIPLASQPEQPVGQLGTAEHAPQRWLANAILHEGQLRGEAGGGGFKFAADRRGPALRKN